MVKVICCDFVVEVCHTAVMEHAIDNVPALVNERAFRRIQWQKDVRLPVSLDVIAECVCVAIWPRTQSST
jgi:hypothetical protein